MFVDWGLCSIAAYSPYKKGARLYPDWYEYKCRPEYKSADSAAELPFEKRADGLLVRVPDGFAKSPLPFVIAVTGTSGS